MSKPKKRKRRKLLIGLVVCIAICAAVAFKFFKKPDDLIAVQVEKVTRRDITEIVVANGRIQPVTQVVISPEVAGEIV
ncbi:MAG: efflux RND transporter periplasmic adaptor subunit, partial [Verrucomicrobiaceae bacterium]